MTRGLYKHTKTGKHYKVIGIALHSETQEEFVVYECQYENPRSKLWIRPKEMFLEKVNINGKQVPRFELLKKE